MEFDRKVCPQGRELVLRDVSRVGILTLRDVPRVMILTFLDVPRVESLAERDQG